MIKKQQHNNNNVAEKLDGTGFSIIFIFLSAKENLREKKAAEEPTVNILLYQWHKAI